MKKTKERKAVLNISLPLYQIVYLDKMSEKSGQSISRFIQEWIDNAMMIDSSVEDEVKPDSIEITDEDLAKIVKR